MQLTKNFSLEELTRSDIAARYGLDNTPNQTQINNLTILCQKLLQPIRDKYGPVFVSSGYRSPAVNAKAGGSQNPPSAHMNGQAADFTLSNIPNLDMAFQTLKNSDLNYDKIIQEFGQWIHIQYRADLPTQRHEAYYAKIINGETKYIPA